MKKTFFLYMTIALMALGSCEGSMTSASYDYAVEVQLGDSLKHDSVSLFVVNDTYGSLQRGGAVKLDKGRWLFSGQTEGVRVAFLKLDSLERPFYFVLEPGRMQINIDLRSWTINGGHENSRYVWLLNERQRLIDARRQNRETYLKAAADTTLSLRSERRAVLRDSLLSDSLQHLLIRYMSGGDAVSRIVRERFINDLSAASRKQLNSDK